MPDKAMDFSLNKRFQYKKTLFWQMKNQLSGTLQKGNILLWPRNLLAQFKFKKSPNYTSNFTSNAEENLWPLIVHISTPSSYYKPVLFLLSVLNIILKQHRTKSWQMPWSYSKLYIWSYSKLYISIVVFLSNASNYFNRFNYFN